MTDAPIELDGRHERRRQNVEAVVDAIYELWSEGDLKPGAKAIAERSGVSLRSVFRYFDDLDSLVNTAIERHSSRTDHQFELLDPGGSLEERAARLAAHRVVAYGESAAVTIATKSQAPFHPPLTAELARRGDQLRDQLAALFGPELNALPDDEAAEVLASVELATGFDATHHLCHARGFTAEQAERTLARIAARLVPDPGAATGRGGDD